jgi:lipoyl(octanoyl) transferase
VYYILVLDLKRATESNFTSPIVTNYLGCQDFSSVFNLQEVTASRVSQTNQVIVIGCEHNDVITLGRRALAKEILNSGTLPIVHTTRGGLATIHSRGQLVIYPILDLRQNNLSVKGYVELLLDTTTDFLNLYNVTTAKDMKQVGLYTEQGKVVFCGVEIRRRVSLHGISINVSNDLNLFKLISPCGLENSRMDKLQNYSPKNHLGEIDPNFDLNLMFRQWSRLFQDRLNILR